MAYEAVPDDVEIQKLTALERDALSRYKIHENINTFLGNEGMPKLILGGIAVASLPIIIPAIIAALSRQIPSIPDDAKDIVDSVVFVNDLNEAVLETLSFGVFGKGETRDFYDKYVKR